MQKQNTDCLDRGLKHNVIRQWNDFKSIMECELFHTTAVLNDNHQLCALIDPGSTAFATISEKHVNRLQLSTQSLQPKLITGVLDNISGIINRIASFSLDIGGLKIDSVCAYVVKNKTEDMILGMPWLKYCHAELDSVKSKLNFKLHNLTLISDEARKKKTIN